MEPIKVCLYNDSIHHKNKAALMKYKTVEILPHSRVNECNYIYSPGTAINIDSYKPGTKFMFGPHFSVFPEEYKLVPILGKENCLYIQPSQWVVDLWKQWDICKNLKMAALPFGVDTEKFCETKPIDQRHKVFIYHKRRKPEELAYIEVLLKSQNIEYRIFNYGTGNGYSEQEYLEYLQDSKYGIVLDAHESQGFAIGEAMSCNVPLLVWNVTSMNQEHGSGYSDYKATSVPYWDSRCGLVFYKSEELSSSYNRFMEELPNYKPRQYVIENISIEACSKKFLDILKSI